MSTRRKIRWPKVGEDVCVEWADACLYEFIPPHRLMEAISEEGYPLQRGKTSGTVAYSSRKSIGLAQTVNQQPGGHHSTSELMVVPRANVTRVRRFR